MSESPRQYFALRLRSADELHHKGDVQYGGDTPLFIGQTGECSFRIPAHPDYADSCYAVIVPNDDRSGWHLVRQEDSADITVNGIPLALVCNLHNGDLLEFDHTLVQFTEEKGERPSTLYVHRKAPWAVWAAMAGILLVLVGIVMFLFHQNQKLTNIFKNESASICKIESDTLLVISTQGDTLEILPCSHPMVGTGFITEEGYFVTARHCVEFWLALENELQSDVRNIREEAVRWAIRAETDTTIRLITRLKITSRDGSHTWYHDSDAFTMDKSRDNVYELGGFETPYLWRSVVSLYEHRGAELGDAAVMRWPHGIGNIRLEEADVPQQEKNALYCFGYPQSDSRQEAVFSSVESSLYQVQSPDECFICEKGLDPGFSGGPVFTNNLAHPKVVVGLVSRSDGSHTLMVPVSQIHRLINKTDK